MSGPATKTQEKPKEEEASSWAKFKNWYFNWATGATPKGKTEKWLEWLPVTGSIISIKDTAVYYRDGHWIAGTLMAGATAISIAGDVATFGLAGLIRKGVKLGIEATARQTIKWTAKDIIKLGQRLTGAKIKNAIVKEGGVLTREKINEIATSVAKEIAELFGSALPKPEMKKMIAEATQIGKKASERYVKLLKSMPEEVANYKKELIMAKAWEEAAGKEGWKLLGQFYQIAKTTLTKLETGGKKVGSFVSEIAGGEPMKYTKKATERAAETAAKSSSALVRKLIYVASGPEIAANWVLDLARTSLKGGGWLVRKTYEPLKEIVTAAPKRLVLESTVVRKVALDATPKHVKNKNQNKKPTQEEKKVAEVKRQKNEAPRLSFSKEEEAEVAAQEYRANVLAAIDALDTDPDPNMHLDPEVKKELTGRIERETKDITEAEVEKMKTKLASIVNEVYTNHVLDDVLRLGKGMTDDQRNKLLAPLSE